MKKDRITLEEYHDMQRQILLDDLERKQSDKSIRVVVYVLVAAGLTIIGAVLWVI